MKPFASAAAASLTLTLAGTAAACGDSTAADNDTTDAPSTNSSESSGASGGAYDIVYISGQRAAQAYIQIGCAGEAFANGRDDVNFSVQAPDQFDPQAQIPIVNAVIADKPDAILISVTDPTALIEPLRAAADQGIKVVTVGNSLAEQADFETSEVLGDNHGAGVELAEAIMAEYPDGGTIAMVGYQPGGSAITDARQAGFEEALAGHDEYKLVTEYVKVDQTEAAAKAAALIAAHDDLIAINGTFDSAQDGVQTAVTETGLQDDVMVVAYDALSHSVDAIGSGVFDIIAGESFRDQGTEAMKQAITALEGGTPEAVVNVPSVTFNADNYDDPELESFRLADSC